MFVALGYFALALHIAPEYGKVFWKENLTLQHTIVTESDVKSLVTRFNNASYREKTQMNNDPFMRALEKAGIIGSELNY